MKSYTRNYSFCVLGPDNCDFTNKFLHHGSCQCLSETVKRWKRQNDGPLLCLFLCFCVLLLGMTLTPSILQRTSLSNLQHFTTLFLSAWKKFCWLYKQQGSDSQLCVLLKTNTNNCSVLSLSSWSVLLLVRPRWKSFFLKSQWITWIWQEGGLKPPESPPSSSSPLPPPNDAATVSPRQNELMVLAADQHSSYDSIKRNKDVTGLFGFAGKTFRHQ